MKCSSRTLDRQHETLALRRCFRLRLKNQEGSRRLRRRCVRRRLNGQRGDRRLSVRKFTDLFGVFGDLNNRLFGSFSIFLLDFLFRDRGVIVGGCRPFGTLGRWVRAHFAGFQLFKQRFPVANRRSIDLFFQVKLYVARVVHFRNQTRLFRFLCRVLLGDQFKASVPDAQFLVVLLCRSGTVLLFRVALQEVSKHPFAWWFAFGLFRR